MPQNRTRSWYFRGTAKYAEDQRPDEDVVDAEALLDEEAGVVLARRPGRRRPTARRGRRPGRRRSTAADSIAASLGVHGVGLAVEHQEVDQQQHDDEGEEQHPHGEGDVDLREVLHRSGGSEGGDHQPFLTRLSGCRAPEPHHGLGRGQPGDGHAVRRAAHVVETGVVEEAGSTRGRHRARRRRRASARAWSCGPGLAPSRTSSPTPAWSMVSNGLRFSRPGLEVGRHHPALDVVAAEAERHLGEVVGAEARRSRPPRRSRRPAARRGASRSSCR